MYSGFKLFNVLNISRARFPSRFTSIVDLTLLRMGWDKNLQLLKIGAGQSLFKSFLGYFHAPGEVFGSAEFFW